MPKSAQVIRGARFPGRYLQGKGALDRLGEEAARFSGRACVLVDAAIFDMVSERTARCLASIEHFSQHRFGGECTESAISDLIGLAAHNAATVVVGIGGGKTLDTAKAAAAKAGLPVIIVPTIAASDAPCSALSVIYKDDGTVAHDLFLPRNPDLVLVDTEIIANAPSRFLAAGIGDALATWYEANSCQTSGAKNCLGLPGLPLAYAVARQCLETVLEHGAAALAECDKRVAGPALERVVEANILLSGLGFESGGVAAAHAIHHGLTELDETHAFLHGEKVAIGVLAGLILNGQDAEFDRVRRFCQETRLPTRLADIGISDVTDAKLQLVARRACRPGEIIHNEPFAVSEDQVVAALRRLI